jgi:hypothetical protein
VQFRKSIIFRVIRVLDWPTYDGWRWLDGYELNPAGDAVDRRSIYVRLDGLRWLRTAPESRPAAVPPRQAQARTPVRVG